MQPMMRLRQEGSQAADDHLLCGLRLRCSRQPLLQLQLHLAVLLCVRRLRLDAETSGGGRRVGREGEEQSGARHGTGDRWQ